MCPSMKISAPLHLVDKSVDMKCLCYELNGDLLRERGVVLHHVGKIVRLVLPTSSSTKSLQSAI